MASKQVMAICVLLTIFTEKLVYSCELLQVGSTCQFSISSVILVEQNVLLSAESCQKSCSGNPGCSHFSFFAAKCILFKECSKRQPCSNCLTGPAKPPISKCGKSSSNRLGKQVKDEVTESEATNAKAESSTPPPESATESENETPTAETPASMAESTTPLAEPTPPITESTPPITESTPPITESTPPITESTPPISESTPPITESTPPIAESTPPPITGSTPPIIESTPSIAEPTPPKSESTPTITESPTATIAESTAPTAGSPTPIAEINASKSEAQAPMAEPETSTPMAQPSTSPEEQEPEITSGGAEDNEIDMDEVMMISEEAFPDDYFDVDSSGDFKPTVQYVQCLFGGYGPSGPIPQIGVIGPLDDPVAPTVAPLPPTFPMGHFGIHATVIHKTLHVCSPGTIIEDHYHQHVTLPGQCFTYRVSHNAWVPLGTPMHSHRLGAAVTTMGRFVVALGGHKYPTPLNTIEVLSTSKPKAWKTLSKLALPNPTYDHCAVAINDTAIFVTGGHGHESQALIMDFYGKTFLFEEPMHFPRRQHSCIKAEIQGKPGIIVAGGTSDLHSAIRPVEFFDLMDMKWKSLGRAREGRRFPGLMVMGKHLTLSGGETVDSKGNKVILDSMETLIGHQWVPLAQKLPEKRSRFAMIQLPRIRRV